MGTSTWVGVAIFAVTMGTANLLAKIGCDKIGWKAAGAANIMVGFTVVMSFAVLTVPKSDYFNSKIGLIAAGMAGLLGAIGFLALNWVLESDNLSRAGVVLSATNPLVIAMLGILVLKERMSLIQAAGLLLCVIGIYLLSRS